MKWFSLLPLCSLLLVSNACERHPASDLNLIEASKTEGVNPQPKREGPQLETTVPETKSAGYTK